MDPSRPTITENPPPGGPSELRRVVAMTIPAVITTSSRAVMDVSDYIMISFLPEERTQAAILPAQMLVWSYVVLGMGLVAMVNTFASQALGRKRYEECSGFAWQSLYIAAFFGLVGILLAPLLGMLVRRIGHEPAVQKMELAYLEVALLTTAPTIASNGLAWFFVGIHRPWVSTWSAIEANLVNVVVSLVLVFGFLGVPPMGIAGAAWGTVTANIYRTIRLAVTMLRPDSARRFSSRSTWRPSWTKLTSLIRVGSPFGIQMVFEVIVWAVFVNVLVGAKFGTVHLIATNAVWQYMRIAFMPPMGVGQALTALVGHAVGSGSPDLARRQTRMAVLVTVAYTGLLSIVYAVWGGTLVGLFSDDAEVIRVGRQIMYCAAVFQLFDAIGMTYAGALRGAGDTFIPSVVFTLLNWIIIIGGGWLCATLWPRLGSVGPWMAASLLIVVAALFFWWRWRSGAWRRIDIFGTAGRSEASEEQVRVVLP